MELDASLTNEFIDQILELSADAHVRRRAAIKNSAEFHNLTGAITAYGAVLAVLTTLQRVQELYERPGKQCLPDCPQLTKPEWVS